MLEPSARDLHDPRRGLLGLPEADHDFHPTDVRDDADMAAWSCSADAVGTSSAARRRQIGKPNVLGAIYRVRPQGEPLASEDPRELKTRIWARCDSRRPRRSGWTIPAPRFRAGDARPGQASGESKRPGGRRGDPKRSLGRPARNAVWAATRVDRPAAPRRGSPGLDRRRCDRSPGGDPRGERLRDQDASAAVARIPSGIRRPANTPRRGRGPSSGSAGRGVVPALLEAAGEPADRALEHSLTYARHPRARRPRPTDAAGWAQESTM